jgi:hypothetical protein
MAPLAAADRLRPVLHSPALAGRGIATGTIQKMENLIDLCGVVFIDAVLGWAVQSLLQIGKGK